MIDSDLVKQKTDIVDLISRYVKLSNGWKEYRGICPFHNDKTPSMVVNRDKGLFHCYGCGIGGDAISFLMKIEKTGFQEALKILADKAGVDAESNDGGMYSIMRDVSDHYARTLFESPLAESARSYLRNRGYSEDVWRKFKIGYALPLWENVRHKFARQDEEMLISSGLLVRKRGKIYDRFRDRLMFPISDNHGRVIAFGGRSFGGEPKYLNSPNTPLFDKGGTLYGIHFANAQTADTMILVEGFTDVISLHIAGITNVVSSMGTALAHGQAEVLSRLVTRVAVAYDADSAGVAATVRGMKVLRNNGIDVLVVVLANGEDPDSFVQERGADAFLERVRDAVPFQRFYLDQLAKQNDLKSTAGRERFIKQAKEFCDGIDSPLLQQEIIDDAASMAGISAAIVSRDFKRKIEPAVEAARQKDILTPEETLMVLFVRDEMPLLDIGIQKSVLSDANQRIIEFVEGATALDVETMALYSRYALSSIVIEDKEKAAKDAVRSITKTPKIKERVAELNVKMKELAGANALKEWAELAREKTVLLSYSKK